MTDPEKTIEDRVRERAYALWERDGRREGRSDEYWQQARAEVEAEDAEPGNEIPEEPTKEASSPTARPSKASR
jgi:Protein of unknown function (DUF2934)